MGQNLQRLVGHVEEGKFDPEGDGKGKTFEGLKQVRNMMWYSGDSGVAAVPSPGLQGEGPTECNVELRGL